MTNAIDLLLSVPPAAASAREPSPEPERTFAASDPPGRQLGSGGGTAHLLHAAWKASENPSFTDWLRNSRKMIIHGSGQSRRLPAYAAEGKLNLPLPTLPGITGQPPDQILLDLQKTDYGRLFRHAPPGYRVMLTCGDVIVRSSHWVPRFPEADILILTLKASAEEASNHGALFSHPDSEEKLAFFLQKPSAERILELSRYEFSLDTGVWLFSERAIQTLLRKCGWNPQTETFAENSIAKYELFDSFGPSLGETPSQPDPLISPLSCAVVPIPDGRFFHFGSNRSVFSSIAQLYRPAENQRAFGHAANSNAANHIVLHSEVAATMPACDSPMWIENSAIPAGWRLNGSNILTGIPENTWSISLPAGVCLDAIALRGRVGMVFRPYGIDDLFKGAAESLDTLWMGHPLSQWLATRGIEPDDAGISPLTDIQDAPLFPLLDITESGGELLQWMIEPSPRPDAKIGDLWLKSPRLSATDIIRDGDVAAREKDRRHRMLANLAAMDSAKWRTLAGRLDLERCAAILRDSGLSIPAEDQDAPPSLESVHLSMLRARSSGRIADEEHSFEMLRKLVSGEKSFRSSRPNRNVLDDQIIWARAPARMDLAGGWSDTPPYCLAHGGRVVNVAVDLNGQPPIQAFARICETPALILHSIDLGISETISTYEELMQPSILGGFSIARAALRLAGFDPAFHADGGRSSLRRQLLREFGGGIELNMLCAIPKGSGLGTSSILIGTLLGLLSELCGLGWSRHDLYARTSAVEQILTSGGGWQDQVGGLAPGLKLVETRPGLSQTPVIRWLPETLFREGAATGRILLYYTGITRLARNILAEIARGIFLNDRRRISIIEEIARTADFAADRIQRQDWEGMREAIRRSWTLNQELDSGTNPPAVQDVLRCIEPWSPAVKLPGAGGGGYLLILAEDLKSAAAIRETLEKNPPNPRARFVNLRVSDTGLQITRS